MLLIWLSPGCRGSAEQLSPPAPRAHLSLCLPSLPQLLPGEKLHCFTCKRITGYLQPCLNFHFLQGSLDIAMIQCKSQSFPKWGGNVGFGSCWPHRWYLTVPAHHWLEHTEWAGPRGCHCSPKYPTLFLQGCHEGARGGGCPAATLSGLLWGQISFAFLNRTKPSVISRGYQEGTRAAGMSLHLEQIYISLLDPQPQGSSRHPLQLQHAQGGGCWGNSMPYLTVI